MDKIKVGDIVTVNFNNAQTTLCKNSVVLYIPAATGDSWIFEDVMNQTIHYVSEGCTVSRTDK